LFEKVLYKNVDAVIARSFAAGVSQSVLISIDAHTSATSVGICKKHLQSLYATAGVHPLYIGNAPASRGDDEEKKQIEEDEKALQPVQVEGAEVKPEENNNNNEKPKEKDLKTELNAITALIKHNPEYIVAVGEIGLDFKDNLAPGMFNGRLNPDTIILTNETL
jgi:Tat protein secretion system quality control protein TatD with DNase activity